MTSASCLPPTKEVPHVCFDLPTHLPSDVNSLSVLNSYKDTSWMALEAQWVSYSTPLAVSNSLHNVLNCLPFQYAPKEHILSILILYQAHILSGLSTIVTDLCCIEILMIWTPVAL